MKHSPYVIREQETFNKTINVEITFYNLLLSPIKLPPYGNNVNLNFDQTKLA